MKWHCIPLGALQTNCYVLAIDNQNCLIVDPGGDAERLISFVNEKKYQPQAILLTHAHFDHIGALDEVRDYFDIPVYIHEQEAGWLFDPSLNGSQFFQIGTLIRMKPADHILTEEKHMQIGDFKFQLLETPGHSPGSVTFYFPESSIAVSGDALFQGSIGRTDLPGGNHAQLIKSIHDKLLGLPEETIVLSGHGPATTIGEEMDSNPFLNGF
ncbi:MBL fold metallo-hydrolase [Bacillus mesophilum]|uniref:MBL fold metallo-hydrolase n=1 Tax=Bacillus mesophilum TaxID=1071718 RepID=A0A7V7UW63_9BACI|nr:MBL fold metallo-hydrolase [Bacillus mesophilum]KAB2333851.1 MBL fold metallo-hydrolase [Bacillus mesophilum]